MYKECTVGPCGNSIFSSGLCRKHYEQERLKKAASCSFASCENKAYRGVLCATHYRAKIKESHPICNVPNCSNHQNTLKSGLCTKHAFRFERHKSLDQPRAPDWGARETHPLYNSYHLHKRKGDIGMCLEWQEDFWAFVKVLQVRPEKHTLRKHDQTKPIAPDNWYWRPSVDSTDKPKYQRHWRTINPEKAKNSDLKKKYGISLTQYNELADQQKYRCAICGEKESGLCRSRAPMLMPVDHCHKSGKVRALLCSSCNKGLGAFKDSPILLKLAVKYLEKHKISPTN